MATSPGKRDALIAAGRSVVLSSGAAALTLEPVLKAAGAGTGTFYHHFPGGRAQLVAAIYAEAAAEYEAGLLRVLQRNRDAEGGVKALVHHHVRLVSTDSDLLRVLIENRGEETPEVARPLQRVLQAWAAAAGLSPLPSGQLASLWLGPVLEWCRLALGGTAGGSPEAAAERLAQAAWDSLNSS